MEVSLDEVAQGLDVEFEEVPNVIVSIILLIRGGGITSKTTCLC